MAVIFKNDFSASYFTYNNSYWTVYYEKPFCRIHSFLLGVLCGCNYFTFKYDQYEDYAIPRFFRTL